MSAQTLVAPGTTVTEGAPAPDPGAAPADGTSAPKPPEGGSKEAAPDGRGDAKSEPAAPAEPSPELVKALANVRGLAGRLRAAERENRELKASADKPAATPPPAAKTETTETPPDPVAALPKETDSEGKELVQYLGEWMSPAMAREMIDARQFREDQHRQRSEAEVAKRTADRETAYREMANGIEASVTQLMKDSFSAIPAKRQPRVEAFLVSVADDIIAKDGEQAKAEGRDPFEMLLQDGYLEGVMRAVQTEGRETFGALAEAQVLDNKQHEIDNPVTTPKGGAASEHPMGIEEYEALSPAERRRVDAGVKARYRPQA